METVDRWVTTAVAAWPLLVLLAGIIYPFLPGPVRAWLLAQKAKAASDTHVNDTLLLLSTLWRGYQDAKRLGGSQEAAIASAIIYVNTNRPDLVAKLGASAGVMSKMLGAQVQDHEDALKAATATAGQLVALRVAAQR
jgi:hypothetical protein